MAAKLLLSLDYLSLSINTHKKEITSSVKERTVCYNIFTKFADSNEAAKS
jgi:hypothetical protein